MAVRRYWAKPCVHTTFMKVSGLIVKQMLIHIPRCKHNRMLFLFVSETDSHKLILSRDWDVIADHMRLRKIGQGQTKGYRLYMLFSCHANELRTNIQEVSNKQEVPDRKI